MPDKNINQVRMKVTSSLYRAFYTDIMPIVQKIKDGVSALNINETDNNTITQIKEQLTRAESLLKQLKTLADGIEEHDK